MTTAPFSKILIANRGEIACRIARSARALGYRTVAVHSDADAAALHVGACHEAEAIGPAPVADSYLKIEAILSAARRSGADAVHPGYGFLSENADFAAACLDAGLTFIGPPASAIAAMGNKAAAKRRMIEAGVPCVPGYQGADQSDAALLREAGRIGFPVMVKAAAGGGGRGMRLVTASADLPAALSAARSEAERAFGSGELILEKAVVDARHVEIQVFADLHGNVIHLGERDCSVQRRHQKVIEEAPSPAVSPALRARMGAAAVKAAQSIGYVGAGTVEFLLGSDGAFYFLEMNTRLQVEHPVTEAITGLDLVAWQLRVARGERLPLGQDDLRFDGHAIEVRLYAEDPATGFLPQSGDVQLWRPPSGVGIRCDHGLSIRDTVSPHYDPMIAKVIAHGATREDARRRLLQALDATAVLGIATNRSFLVDALSHPEFAAGTATTAFIGRHFAPGSDALRRPAMERAERAVAAALLLAQSGEWPCGSLAGWSSTGAASYPVRFDDGRGGEPRHMAIRPASAGHIIVADGDELSTVGLQPGSQPGDWIATVGTRRMSVTAVARDGFLHLALSSGDHTVRDLVRLPRTATDAMAGGQLLAPMNGRVVRVAAKAGDVVRKGQCVVVLEAMKMQHEITAPRDGVLARVAAIEGQQVATRAVLAEVT